MPQIITKVKNDMRLQTVMFLGHPVLVLTVLKVFDFLPRFKLNMVFYKF